MPQHTQHTQHTSPSNSAAAAETKADERSFDEQLHSRSPTVPEEPNVDTLFDYDPSASIISVDMLFDYQPDVEGHGELLFDYPNPSSHASNMGSGFTYSGNGRDVTAPPYSDF